MKNNSFVDFETCFLHTFICFLSPQCNFWLIFKYFTAKILHFLQPVVSYPKLLWKFKGRILKITLKKKKMLTVLHTNGHISKSRRSMNLIFSIKLKLKVCSLQWYQKLILPKMLLVLCFVGASHKNYYPKQQNWEHFLRHTVLICDPFWSGVL